MSLRNLHIPLVNGDGVTMKETINGVDRDATISNTVRAALATGPMAWEPRAVSFIPDPNVSPDEKLRMYDLALKLRAEGPANLKAEDIILIKKCVAHTPPFVYGQVCLALEQDIPPAAE